MKSGQIAESLQAILNKLKPVTALPAPHKSKTQTIVIIDKELRSLMIDLLNNLNNEVPTNYPLQISK